MICDQAQRLASSAIDDGLAPADAGALTAHLAVCGECREFEADLHRLRQRLRLQPVTVVPDIATRVIEELQHEPARTGRDWGAIARMAAVFVLAVVAGATAVGISGPQPVLAESLGRRLLSAQDSLTSMTADVRVVERGWHADVGVRTYTGSLTYLAPESVALRLRDTTTYPSSSWRPNDVNLVVAEARSVSRALRPCPRALQPGCLAEPRTAAVTARAPFDAANPVPLDVVMPVTSLGEHSTPHLLGSRRVDGEAQIGVRVTAAQIEPLLDGITGAGNWRAVHPADTADVWLDDATLTPRDVAIFPADDPDRRRWAASEGYDDPAGKALLTIEFADVRTNAEVDSTDFAVPAAARATDAGFVDSPADDVPSPDWLPQGVAAHRRGRQGTTSIATWSDGRAWVRIAASRRWEGGRLLGDLGEVIRRVELPTAGTAYVSASGRGIGLHGRQVDVAVTGSFDEATLLRVADSLGVRGVPVPRSWRESSAASIGAAARELPDLLHAPELPGFAAPAVRVEAGAVTLAYAGAGSREFVVVQRAGDVLTPPMDAHVIGVRVRGIQGRYTPARGELEWVERGRTVLIRSETLGFRELLSVADLLRPWQ